MTRKPSLGAAFRANLVPAMILWIGTSLVLVLYHSRPGAREILNQIASLKTSWGLVFVMPVQAFAAGVLPFLFQAFQKGNAPKTPLAHAPWLILVWAVQGAMSSTFYDFQAKIFGDNSAFGTITVKTAVDMFLYTPLISTPFVVLCYAFKDTGFSFSRTRAGIIPGWYRSRVLPLYQAALLIWTPAVCLIYALPLPLQFPIQAAVQCFFTLIVIVMTHRPTIDSP